MRRVLWVAYLTFPNWAFAGDITPPSGPQAIAMMAFGILLAVFSAPLETLFLFLAPLFLAAGFGGLTVHLLTPPGIDLHSLHQVTLELSRTKPGVAEILTLPDHTSQGTLELQAAGGSSFLVWKDLHNQPILRAPVIGSGLGPQQLDAHWNNETVQVKIDPNSSTVVATTSQGETYTFNANEEIQAIQALQGQTLETTDIHVTVAQDRKRWLGLF